MERSDSSIRRREANLNDLRSAFDNEPPYSISFSSTSNIHDDTMSEMGATLNPILSENDPNTDEQKGDENGTSKENADHNESEPQSHPTSINNASEGSETPNIVTSMLSGQGGQGGISEKSEDKVQSQSSPVQTTANPRLTRPSIGIGFIGNSQKVAPVNNEKNDSHEPIPIQTQSAFTQPERANIGVIVDSDQSSTENHPENQHASLRQMDSDVQRMDSNDGTNNVQGHNRSTMKTTNTLPQAQTRSMEIGLGNNMESQRMFAIGNDQDVKEEMYPLRTDAAFPQSQTAQLDAAYPAGIEEEEKREIGQDDHTPLVSKKEDDMRVNFAPRQPSPTNSLEESILYEDKPQNQENSYRPEPAPLPSIPSLQVRQRYPSQYPQRQSMFQSQYTSVKQDNPARSLWLAGLLLILAGVGLGIGLLLPGSNNNANRSSPPGSYYNDTTDPNKKDDDDVVCDPGLPDWINNLRNCTKNSETESPVASPNFYDEIYAESLDLIMSYNISDPATLSNICYSPLCVNNEDAPANMTIQQQALNFLVFEDSLTITWLFSGDYNHERFIQRYILTVFGKSLGISEWDSTLGWTDGSLSECDWYGIECGDRLATMRPEGRTSELIPMVTRIDLTRNSLKGSIPDELTVLRHLEKLELSHNELTGTIPKGIDGLQSLKRLWLMNTTGLSGSIPTQIGKLKNMKSLDLAMNSLTGTIPKEIGNLVELRLLSTYENQLKGAIPNELSNCLLLMQLFLDGNKLSGPLPPTIGALAELRDFRVHKNELNGMLPPSMAALNKLRVLYLDQNSFTGAIGSHFVASWVNLEYLDAWDNRFSGVISPNFGLLTKLVSLDLHGNQIDSAIPENLCQSGTLMKLNLANNMIRGSIPASLKDCTKMRKLVLSQNVITGTVPAFLGTKMPQLGGLYLDNNDLTGTIPYVLQTASNIVEVQLHNNKITGSFFEQFCDDKQVLSADCSAVGCSCCTCCGDCDE